MLWMRAPGEAVAGTGLTLVVGTGNGEDVVLDVDSELLKDIELELALGALDDNVVAVDCHFDSGGIWTGLLPIRDTVISFPSTYRANYQT